MTIASLIERSVLEELRLRPALEALRATRAPDCWMAAGVIRNAVWDGFHGRRPSIPEDIDAIYFDPSDLSLAREARIEEELRRAMPELPWSVRNQARMHLRNGHAPYRSSSHAMAHWVETVTAIAVRLGRDGAFEMAAPLGLVDLEQLILRPGPAYLDRLDVFHARLEKKGWRLRWPRMRVVDWL